jgi:hypothetical protein
MFNPPEELQTRYSETLAKVKANLGKEYPMFIKINKVEIFAPNVFTTLCSDKLTIILLIYRSASP